MVEQTYMHMAYEHFVFSYGINCMSKAVKVKERKQCNQLIGLS